MSSCYFVVLSPLASIRYGTGDGEGPGGGSGGGGGGDEDEKSGGGGGGGSGGGSSKAADPAAKGTWVRKSLGAGW